MKSFLLISLSFAIIISAFAAPQKSVEKLDEDVEARAVIADLLLKIQLMSGENEIAGAVVKSIDQDCMLEKYKKHNFIDSLTEEAVDITSVHGSHAIDPLLVFFNIALTCSNKLEGLLAFLFDNAFSYSSLLEVFRDDEPIKGYLDQLQCYNNYAIDNNFINAELFPRIKHELVNQTEEECKRIVNEGKRVLYGTVEFGAELIIIDRAECLSKELVSTAEKFFLKYVLLIPAGLNDDQKKVEKANFFKDVHDTLGKLLLCNAKEEINLSDNEV